MLKGMVVEVAKEVGRSGAILLNQLYQWFKTQNVLKVYRTNAELADDLCGILSVATIQRAKMKLIEKGYVEVSFDKGHKRTTHYSLTQKAKDALSGVIKSVSAPQEAKPKKPSSPAKPSQAQPAATSPAMAQAFAERGTEKRTAPPASFKELLKGAKRVMGKKVEEDHEVVHEDNTHELFPKEQGGIFDQEISDEEYFNSIDTVLNLAFNKVPNVEVRNSNLAMADLMGKFKGEEY